MELTSAWRTVAGRRMHERRGGAAGAPPLVLVHGLGVSSRYLVPVAERLAAERRVLAPDLPGFGRSEPPHGMLDVPGLADALSAWLDAAGLERTPVLANSLGCQVAVELAVREPARVEALVLVGPTVDPSARSLPRQALRLLATAPHEARALLALVAYEYGTRPRRTLRTARAMVRHRIEDALPRLETPTLVVRGDGDRVVPQRWAAEAARLARGRLEVLAGGHALNFTSPDALARATLAFLPR
jgi:pimeloyl-ACP methyl ester carboxylesterase